MAPHSWSLHSLRYEYSLFFHRARTITCRVKQQKLNSRIYITGTLSTLHPRYLKTERPPVILELRSMRLTQEKKNKTTVTLQLIVFEKLCFQTVFCPHKNKTLKFSHSSGIRSVFKMLRFCDRLVRTIGIPIEMHFKVLQGNVDGVCIAHPCCA